MQLAGSKTYASVPAHRYPFPGVVKIGAVATVSVADALVPVSTPEDDISVVVVATAEVVGLVVVGIEDGGAVSLVAEVESLSAEPQAASAPVRMTVQKKCRTRFTIVSSGSRSFECAHCRPQ